MKNISVIIPSLDPDEKLTGVVDSLIEAGFTDIILVDDGSNEKNKKNFPERKEVTLIVHPENFGKGKALKTALKYVYDNRPDSLGVVTCDGDGQHLTKDILAVSEKMAQDNKFVLGVRDFSLDNVPNKSRIGNRASSAALKLLSGLSISDTQTGLRAIPKHLIKPMTLVEGSRFEYETNVLLELKNMQAQDFEEVKIDTVYLNENKGSHFKPFKDTIRICKLIIKYMASSFASFAVDILAFFVFNTLLSFGVTLSTVVARIISSVFNFIINKKVVFHSGVSVGKSLFKYYLLAIPTMLVSAFGVSGLSLLLSISQKSPLVLLIKVIVDFILFVLNFRIQKAWIFKKDELNPKAENEQSCDNSAFVSHSQRSANKTGALTAGTIIGRILLSVFTAVVCIFFGVYTLLYVALNGPCEPIRDRLVLSAMQASATKKLPGLFLSDEKVDEIVASSYVVNTDVVSLDEYISMSSQTTANNEWENSIDGMLFEKVKGATYTGYVLLVKDPKRIFVGTSSDYKNNLPGMKIFDMAKKEDAIAVINAGEYLDPGGYGAGNSPMGITYSKGELVWEDSLKRTFIGIDKNDKLVVTEPMTKAKATELQIRDGVSFQNGNTLITHDEDGNISLHYADNNTGTAQRTAIGQRADGAIVLLVTDGRSASSLGATRNDVIDVMVSYGAITAGMLDGGSSTLMYYENYFDKYEYDFESLDEYQKLGLVNKYKAFTTPRRMPTYICVAREHSDATVTK